MSNLDQELESVLARRKKVAETLERLKGRKEQAEANLAQVEDECRSKKIDPEKIDTVIEQLQEKYFTVVRELEKDTEEAERALAPFLGGSPNT